jgi:hypothetical protein
MNWIKKPKYENDSYLFQIYSNEILNFETDDYTKQKLIAFKNKNIDKSNFYNYDKPSLKNLHLIKDLSGSIYTYTIEAKNNLSYENIIDIIKNNIHKDNRRLLIRVNNSLEEYLTKNNDVSCLSLIHYMPEKVRLIFRASDIKNELKTDLITIYHFFVLPIYLNKNILIEVYASTAQNIGEYK